jgi:hypothetical protein
VNPERCLFFTLLRSEHLSDGVDVKTKKINRRAPQVEVQRVGLATAQIETAGGRQIQPWLRGCVMKIETAISLVGVVMAAVLHRKHCRNGTVGDLPMELLIAAFERLEADGRATTGSREWLFEHGVQMPACAKHAYLRRANNQKPAEVEALIRDLLLEGWTKTAIANQLKINRRVVIRVAREAESAQSTNITRSIDLGKSRS